MDDDRETADELRDLLRRNGFVRCDIAACNCGSWHARYGLPERWEEVKDALAEAGHPLCNKNGNLVREALRELVDERDMLRDALKCIGEMTDADNPESYRCDDREGCFDTVYAVATNTLKTPNVELTASRGLIADAPSRLPGSPPASPSTENNPSN